MLRTIILRFAILLLAGSAIAASSPSRPAAKVVRIGLLEGGDYAAHSAAREAFRTQLEAIAPQDIQITFEPTLFKSAEWQRSRCKAMASDLAKARDVDIVLALGPWAAQDLLEAGFTKPIVAMYQSETQLEKLIDSTGKPLAPNLTVTYDPDKLVKDLIAFSRVAKFKKLGVLYFHSAGDTTRLLDHLNTIGKRLGFEAVTAEGYNNAGTFAFFKAYDALDKSVDAVYLLPMWAMDGEKIREFGERLAGDARPSMGAESRFVVERGLLMSATASSFVANGRFDAWKVLRIISGEVPSSLPTKFPDEQVLTINQKTASRLSVDIPLELLGQAELVGAQPDQSETRLTLADAIQRSRDQNPTYLAKYESMAEASARASQAWSSYFPQVSLQGDAEHVSDNALANDLAVINWPQIVRNDHARGSLVLDQQLFSMSAIQALRTAALTRRINQVSVDQATRDLDLAVTLAFGDNLRVTELDAIYRRQRQLADANIEIARAKAGTGEGSDLELNRWRAERMLQSSRLLASRTAMETARIELNALLNQAGTTPLLLDTTLASTGDFWDTYSRLRPAISGAAALHQTQERLTAAALQENPAMRAARATVDMQRQQLRQNRADWMPTLALQARFNLQDQYKDFRPAFGEKGTSWSVSAHLRWSLFDGGRRIKECRALTSQVSGEEYRRDSVGLAIMQQVSSLLAQLAASEAQVAASERLYEMAKAQITGALDQYSRNKVSYLEPLDAARLAEQAQIDLLNARFKFLSTASHLVHDLGWSAFDANMTPSQLLGSRLAAPDKK